MELTKIPNCSFEQYMEQFDLQDRSEYVEFLLKLSEYVDDYQQKTEFLYDVVIAVYSDYYDDLLSWLQAFEDAWNN